MRMVKVLEGSEAVALAVKACRPQVISAYPISPQTHIVEALARMVADGELQSRYVRVESEFSAASVISGASATGSRAYSASSSQGLLLMTEVIYASVGMRLPFVLTGVNRQVSAPISIQVDHQDTISLRDTGIIQIYVESSQEAYDAHIAAFKIAEDSKILLPVMVCMDGWILTHSYERVTLVEQEEINDFLPPFRPPNYLNCSKPMSWGSYAEENVLMEFKYAIQQAMLYAKDRINEIFVELSAITGRYYGKLIERYRSKDADFILVGMGSVAGTVKEAVDRLREAGKKVGLVRIRCYRPFPQEEIWEAIKEAKVVGVMEADYSMGSEGAVGMDLKASICGRPGAPRLMNFIAGLGGREVNTETISGLFEKMQKAASGEAHPIQPEWVGLDPEVLSQGSQA